MRPPITLLARLASAVIMSNLGALTACASAPITTSVAMASPPATGWLHSVRRSIVSAMFVMAADRHAVSLDVTLGQLGITDLSPLTDTS